MYTQKKSVPDSCQFENSIRYLLFKNVKIVENCLVALSAIEMYNASFDSNTTIHRKSTMPSKKPSYTTKINVQINP